MLHCFIIFNFYCFITFYWITKIPTNKIFCLFCISRALFINYCVRIGLSLFPLECFPIVISRSPHLLAQWYNYSRCVWLCVFVKRFNFYLNWPLGKQKWNTFIEFGEQVYEFLTSSHTNPIHNRTIVYNIHIFSVSLIWIKKRQKL